jgi:DMSO/TMAO reductase YedYZ molybdopterin-dependent catalytic subunit
MAVFSPGFTGRKRRDANGLPPGQYLETGFPVLSAGVTPHVRQDDWRFSVTTEAGATTQWTWQQMLDLGPEEVHTDIHCVTSWSKLGTSWRGVPLDRFFDAVGATSPYFMASSYGGYTTNLPTDEVRGRSWLAFEFDGKPLAEQHGGPARLLVPHLYFWKSAKWVTKLTMMPTDAPGFWERYGYNMHGDPWREERYS